MHQRLLPRPHRSLLASSAVALLVVGVAACGSDDDKTSTADGGATTTAAPAGDESTTTTASGDSKADEYVVVAKDFSLTDLTVEPGEEFTLDNQGETTHTLTADDGSFDSGEVAAGSQSDPLTPPDTPGEYAFHCEIHDSMTATLTVEG